MHNIGGHSFPLCDASQLLAEVDVGQLAAAVGEEGQQVVVEVLEVQLLVSVDGACEGDHSAGGALFQPGQKEIGQEEVAQVVDAETHAEVVIRPVEDTWHSCRSPVDKAERSDTHTPHHSISHLQYSQVRVYSLSLRPKHACFWDVWGYQSTQRKVDKSLL